MRGAMLSRVRLIALGLWVFLTAQAAQWSRLVLTPKGERVDKPAAHPLQYFTEYPWLRDEDGDVCIPCSPEERIAAAKSLKGTADVQLIGKVNGLAVYDVMYHVAEEDTGPRWKSILVETNPNAFIEIFHEQKNQGMINPSFLVKAGPDSVLGVVDQQYRMTGAEYYWWFDVDHAVLLDFKPVWDAAQKVVPKGTTLLKGHLKGELTFPRQVIEVGTQPPDLWRCCASRGVVKVRFEIKAGIIVVAEAYYDPNAEWTGNCLLGPWPTAICAACTGRAVAYCRMTLYWTIGRVIADGESCPAATRRLPTEIPVGRHP
jgi:hypothetical protein